MERSAWPKRSRRPVGKRISHACDRCREAKIRCDDKEPACGPCRAKRLECDRGPDWRKMPPRRAKQAPTIEGRLSRIESLLQSAKESRGDSTLAPCHGTVSCVEAGSRVELTRTTTPSKSGQTANFESANSKSIDFPASESSSEISDNTTRPLWQYKTEIPVLRLTESRVSELRQTISQDSSWQRVVIPMFAKPEVLLLVEFYLDGVNPLISLFERNSLLDLCQNHFPVDSDTWDPAWWACLNAIVAISIQMRTISSDFTSVGRFSWSFFKNAFAVHGDLMQGEPTIMSVKAMLNMAMFLSGTTDNSTMMLLLSSAVKQSQKMGLDREHLGSHTELPNPAVIEDRRRAFWVAYLLEATSSMNCGSAPALSKNMAESQLSQSPPLREGDPEATSDPSWSFFGPRVELAVIESKAQEYLRNPTAYGQNLRDKILILKGELEVWRQSLPPSVRPEYSLAAGSEPTQLSAVMLYCAFYRSLDTVNRAYHLSMVYQSTAASVPIALQLSSGRSLDGSRATMRLIRHMQDICYTDLWRFLQYLLCSTLTLYAHILEHPQQVNIVSDLELIGSLVRFLRNMRKQGCDLDRLLMFCTELERSAWLAAGAVQHPSPAARMSDPVSLPSGLGSEPNILGQHSYLRASHDYMPLVQGLIGNIPRLRATSSNILSGILSCLAAEDDGLKSVGPVSLRPGTYGFSF